MPAPRPESPLAAALNALLEHQPMARSRLGRHAGKTLCLALPLFPLRLTLVEDGEGGCRFSPAEAGAETGLTLTPQPAALPRWITGGTLGDLFSADGDGLLAADLTQALGAFDWVLALRPWLGDMAASRVDQIIQGLAEWRIKAVESAGRNVAEYAVHEQALLAEPHTLKEFIAEVDRLREDADRLEARLSLLEDRRASK
jgi:ubiquinone biosynthesis protein UbiJ